MYSTSVIPIATIPPFSGRHLQHHLSPILPLSAPVACCPSICAARFRVRTYLDLAMPISAVGNAGVMIPLQLLHHLYYDFIMFLNEIFTELRKCAVISQNIWPCSGRSSHDRPHRSRYRISVFFPRPLWSCARPRSAVAVHRRWYHGGFADAEAIGGSSSSCPDISSSSLSVQRLLAALYWGCSPIILVWSKSAGWCTRFLLLRLACSSVVV